MIPRRTLSLLVLFHICKGLALQTCSSGSRDHVHTIGPTGPTVKPTLSRRCAIQQAVRTTMSVVAAGCTVPAVCPHLPVRAATPTSLGESIRRSASNIPGLGPADIYYPLSWKGTWKASRQVVIPSSASGERTYLLNYRLRFLSSVVDNAVVADRGFNQAELETALKRLSRTDLGVNNDNIATTTIVRSYEWTETNPNNLRMVMADGTRKEIKVTKRSASEDGWSETSEFQRVVFEDERGIPEVSARRVLTKWRIVDETSVEAIEVVYDAGMSVIDPMGTSFNPPSQQGQRLLSKSRLLLERE